MGFIVYSTETGEILSTVSVPDRDLPLNVPVGCSAIPDAGEGDGATSFVDVSNLPHTHLPKTPLEVFFDSNVIANSTDTLVIDVPEFLGVSVKAPDGNSYELTERGITFSTPEPGEYRFVFTGVKILSKEIVINAT